MLETRVSSEPDADFSDRLVDILSTVSSEAGKVINIDKSEVPQHGERGPLLVLDQETFICKTIGEEESCAVVTEACFKGFRNDCVGKFDAGGR